VDNPIREECEAALEQVERGSEDWLRWWRANGQRELTCILMTAWDPVGVGDVPDGWDEYEHYVPGVAYRLRDAPDDEAAVEQVSHYLNHVERDFMKTLDDRRARTNGYLAMSLVGWHEWSFHSGGRPPRLTQ
jgi:hypothetical protein